MDSIEKHLKLVLDGKGIYQSSPLITDICDYTLAEQNSELTIKGIEPQVSSDFKPIVRSNVQYIVAAVVFNKDGDVLLMQEAKKECTGDWYLPAGRMEPGENLVDAVKREVLEETGLKFEPTTLIMVESSAGNWYRFTFTGNITGGTIKTLAQADEESLQAMWCPDINEMNSQLRCNDIIPLIERAKVYKEYYIEMHSPILPAIQSHVSMHLRLIMVSRKQETNRVHVLVSEKGSPHFPVCEINPARSVYSSLKKFMFTIFGVGVVLPDHKPAGILSVEHNGQEHDGFCLTVLVVFRDALEKSTPNESYTWLQVNPELEGILVGKPKMTILFRQR